MLGLLLNIVHVHAMYTAINSPPPGLQINSGTKNLPPPGFEKRLNSNTKMSPPPGFETQLNTNSKNLPPPGFENQMNSDLQNIEAYCRDIDAAMCHLNHLAGVQSSESVPNFLQLKSTSISSHYGLTNDMLTPENNVISYSKSSSKNGMFEELVKISNPVNVGAPTGENTLKNPQSFVGVDEYVAELQANAPIHESTEYPTPSGRLFNPYFYVELQTKQLREITRNLLQGQHKLGYPFISGPQLLNEKNYRYRFQQPMLNGASTLTVAVDVLGLLVACQKYYAPIPTGTNLLLFTEFYEDDVFCKIRPGAFEFLEHVNSRFRLVIMSSSPYLKIIRIIDKLSVLWMKYAKKQHWRFADRRLPSRAYGDMRRAVNQREGKDLRILRRKSYERVIVVDNQGIF